MFCTSKDRETCNVEKRGCEGCYYMNDENIINEIDFCLAGEYITIEHRQAIEGLLDLYNQAKQQNLKLRLQELPRLQGEIDAYKEFLHQEKEKNKKLEEELNKFRKGEIFSANQAKFMEKQNKVLQKVIDMMVFDIVGSNVFEYIDTGKDMSIDDNIKEYYFKKARGEEDESYIS